MTRRLTVRWRIRATVAAVGLPPLIYLVSLDRIAGWIRGRPLPTAPDNSVDDVALAEWVDRVLANLPLPWRATCLKRAVVLYYLVHRAGRPADLQIGVRHDEYGALAAHAWLVRNGAPYLESGLERASAFQVLTAFPSVTERHR